MKFSWIKKATPSQLFAGISMGTCVSMALASIPFNLSADATHSTRTPRPAATEPAKVGYEPPYIRSDALFHCLRNGIIRHDVHCT